VSFFNPKACCSPILNRTQRTCQKSTSSRCDTAERLQPAHFPLLSLQRMNQLLTIYPHEYFLKQKQARSHNKPLQSTSCIVPLPRECFVASSIVQHKRLYLRNLNSDHQHLPPKLKALQQRAHFNQTPLIPINPHVPLSNPPKVDNNNSISNNSSSRNNKHKEPLTNRKLNPLQPQRALNNSSQVRQLVLPSQC